MTNASLSVFFKWGRFSAVLLVGFLPACSQLNPTERSEPMVEKGTKALVTNSTVTFQDGTDGYAGTRDTYLNQSSSGTNYGGRTTLYVDGDDPIRTGRDLSTLLYFDVSSIPSNATVTSAALTLYVTDATATGYPIYGVQRAWEEDTANWTRAVTGTNWQTAGAKGALDRDPTLLATFIAPSTGGKSASLNASGIGKLQTWVANPASNFGFLIASPTITDKFAFYSHEYGTAAQRPTLVVTYSTTTADCIAPDCCTADAACGDGNACTTDTCVAGVCAYATVPACCNSASECADDGDLCTSTACVGNVCGQATIAGCCLTDSECADANECTTDACVANVCGHAAVAGCCNVASDCNDGNACTADTCVDHACGGTAIAGCCNGNSDCLDGNLCTADTCANNVCIFPVIAGCCVSDGDCSDGNDCTTDTCVAGTCSHAETAPGACGCQSNAACDDGDPCTVDVCNAGVCGNTVADCSDGNPQTTDQCVAGFCTHTGVGNGTTTLTFRNGENAYASASDTKIAQYYPTTPYDTATVLVVDGDEPSGGGNDVATLIKWDNLGIPSDATVTSASITITIGGGTNSASAAAYPIYAMNRAWSAAAATWELAAEGVTWGTSGALDSTDRDPVSIGATPISVSGGATISLNTTGIAKVQSWVQNPATNQGLVLASAINTDGLSLYSGDYSTVAYRPRLSVTYVTKQTVTDPVPVTSAGNSPRYGFFVYSDSHVEAATNPVFSTALAQMNDLKSATGAPPIIAAISLGDHTENGLDASWDWHTNLTGPYWDAAATSFGGPAPRYLAVPGNHDVMDATQWYSYWSEHLPGQASLGGASSVAGVYYAFNYENALFIGLDTNKATNTSTSYLNDAQINLARTALINATSPFKFMFYHMPAFYCGNGGMGVNASSLAYVDLAAQNNVDAIFNGHSHVYSRTCRMTKGHVCTGTNAGTVQVEVGTVGANDARLRELKTTAQSVTGYDASGASLSAGYTCTSAGGYARTVGSQRTFCYVNVRGCWANVNCYQVGNTTPFDSWTINHCQ